MDDFTLKMGQGYMLFIMEDEVKHTFTGATGTSIRYLGGLGEETGFRNSLEAQVEGDEVHLSWEGVNGAGGYAIYRAAKRIEDNSLTDYDLNHIEMVSYSNTSWTDTGAFGDEYYYLVVAVDGFNREKSSTYAIGVKKVIFTPGYTSFSLELEPKTDYGIGWYTTDMFSEDTSTLYYYDREIGSWRGHPTFLPENINDVGLGCGVGYFAYVYLEDMSYAFCGV